MCPVFFIFFVICGYRVKRQHIYDLSAAVLTDDLAFMDRTGICGSVSWK